MRESDEHGGETAEGGESVDSLLLHQGQMARAGGTKGHLKKLDGELRERVARHTLKRFPSRHFQSSNTKIGAEGG